MKKYKRTNWPAKNHSPTEPDKPENCFRLVTLETLDRRYAGSLSGRSEYNVEQGELLVGNNYDLYDNLNEEVRELDAYNLLRYFQMEFKVTFIPWVLARCTIIPL